MDVATLIGIAAGIAVVFGSIVLQGGQIGSYVNITGLVIVVGGAAAGVVLRYSLSSFFGGIKTGFGHSFFNRRTSAAVLIEEIRGLAEIARKSGPLALENSKPSTPFLARGVQMVADGQSAEAIRTTLERERDLGYERLLESSKVFRAFGDAAPAFGMLGTIVGLISMFTHMDDPSKIGPGMAVALLTTFYGAIIANSFCLPLADKLQNRAEEEVMNATMIVDAVVMLREAKSASAIHEELLAYLPAHRRPARDDEREAA